MNSNSEQPESQTGGIEFSDFDELTAYLDGELDETQTQAVENRLGSDSKYLAEMQSLQKTWDLLDTLPVQSPGGSFTKTTMELIVGDAVSTARNRRKRTVFLGRVAVIALLPIVFFATAYGVARRLQSDPDRRLIENLSAIENYSKYEVVDCDIDFLESIRSIDFFQKPTVIVENGNEIEVAYEDDSTGSIPMDYIQRAEYVRALDVEKKISLKGKFEAFEEKPEADRQRLAEFDLELQARENRQQLRSALTGFYEWFKELGLSERSGLQDLSHDERLVEIRSIRHRQAQNELGKKSLVNLPSKEDVPFLMGWCESIFQLKEGQLRDRFRIVLESSMRQKKIGSIPPSSVFLKKSRVENLNLIIGFLLREDRQFVEDLIFEGEALFGLYDILSLNARKQLDSRSEAEQRSRILDWVDAVNQSQQGTSTEDLKKFEMQLGSKVRDRLQKMSSEKYRETLEWMYEESRKSQISSQSWWEQQIEKTLDPNQFPSK
jgi:hypothetical protein